MFIWDFSVIIMLGVTLCLGSVIACWLFYILKNRSSNVLKDWQAIKQCPYCAYVFLDHRHRRGLPCPRCKSYLDDAKE